MLSLRIPNKALNKIAFIYKGPIHTTKTHLSSECIDLVGKRLVHPSSLSECEYKSLLWTALDLRERLGDGHSVLHYLDNFRITAILSKPCVVEQLMVSNAAKMMGTSATIVVHPTWHRMDFKAIGKMLAMETDLALIGTKLQTKAEKLGKISKIPIILLESNNQLILQVLAGFMTAYDHFGHLKRLSIGLIGEPNELLNSYILLCPLMGINVKYFTCDRKQSPMSLRVLEESKKLYADKNECEISEFQTIEKLIDGVDLLVINVENLKKLLETSNKINKALLHCLNCNCSEYFVPGSSVTELKKKHSILNLHWKTTKNFQWIITAAILRLLRVHDHQLPQPTFS